MTLIAAVRDSYGNILLGADSQEDHNDSTLTFVDIGPTRKLMQVGTRPVVWAWQGSSVVGRPFSDWINGPAVDWTNWESVKAAILAEFQRLNNDASNHYGDMNPDWKTSIVIAGTIGGELDVWAVVPGQTQHRVDNANMDKFVGVASNCCCIGWRHIRTHLGATAGNFYDWLHTLSTMAEGIKPPVQVWRLTPGACRELWFK